MIRKGIGVSQDGIMRRKHEVLEENRSIKPYQELQMQPTGAVF